MFKRGMGHIEVILAFVLFIGFLIFGLYFFNPLDSARVLDSTLYYAQDSIYDNSSSNIVSYSVIIKDQVSDEKISFPLERGNADGYGVYAESLNGQKLDVSYSSGTVNIDRQDADNNFITVRFGDFDEFTPLVEGASQLDEGDFSISTSESKKIISEKNLDRLNWTYYKDYEGLKKSFNLPGRTEFSFSVVFSSDDGIYASRTIAEGLDVFSDSERKEILRNDGSISFADVSVRTW